MSWLVFLSVGCKPPAATDSPRERCWLCVRHYTWDRLPYLNQFTASCRRDLCITGFSVNFDPSGSASQPLCMRGAGLGAPLFKGTSFSLFKTCPADDMLCMSGFLTSGFKRNDSSPLISSTCIGVIYKANRNIYACIPSWRFSSRYFNQTWILPSSVITRRKMVWNRRFGTTYRPHIQGSDLLDSFTLEDGTDR